MARNKKSYLIEGEIMEAFYSFYINLFFQEFL